VDVFALRNQIREAEYALMDFDPLGIAEHPRDIRRGMPHSPKTDFVEQIEGA
jgi:hypothetical protein